MFPNFQNCACFGKDLKYNKHNNLHLALKFVLGYYLFLEAHSFSRAMLSENSEKIMSKDN